MDEGNLVLSLGSHSCWAGEGHIQAYPSCLPSPPCLLLGEMLPCF